MPWVFCHSSGRLTDTCNGIFVYYQEGSHKYLQNTLMLWPWSTGTWIFFCRYCSQPLVYRLDPGQLLPRSACPCVCAAPRLSRPLPLTSVSCAGSRQRGESSEAFGFCQLDLGWAPGGGFQMRVDISVSTWGCRAGCPRAEPRPAGLCGYLGAGSRGSSSSGHSALLAFLRSGLAHL